MPTNNEQKPVNHVTAYIKGAPVGKTIAEYEFSVLKVNRKERTFDEVETLHVFSTTGDGGKTYPEEATKKAEKEAKERHGNNAIVELNGVHTFRVEMDFEHFCGLALKLMVEKAKKDEK